MAEYVSASIEIGGTLSAADYSDLVAIISSERLSIEWDGEPFEAEHRTIGEALHLYAHNVPWGRFDQLEQWCVAMKLPFARWCEGCPGEWCAQRVVFTGEGEPTCYDADTADRILLDRPTAQALGSLAAINAWFDAADFPVPPLIVEDESADTSLSDGKPIADKGWALHYTIGRELAAQVKSGDFVHLPAGRGRVIVSGGRAPRHVSDRGSVIIRNPDVDAPEFETRPITLGMVWISAIGGWSELPA